MADRRISELQEILAAEVRPEADVLALADVSASETRKIKVAELAEAGADSLPDGSVSGSVIENGTITGEKLVDGTITGDKIATDTITAENIAPNSIGASELADDSVDTNALQDGAVTGDKIASDTITADHLAPGSVGESELADNSVDTDAIQDDAVTGSKLDESAFGRGIDKQTDVVGHSESYFPAAPTSFAGVTVDEFGHVSSFDTEIPVTDLPIATDSVNGVSHYPASGGLSVSGTGAVSHINTVAPATHTKITYDANGHVTSGTDLESADLPLATATEPGAVSVPGPTLAVDANGALTHASSGVTPGVYPKVRVDEDGHVVEGLALEASDIPDLSFDQITSGEIGEGVLGECAVNAPNICDYATVLMQEDNPGQGDYLGQLWWTPSTAQLYIYARGSGPQNLWRPVGFGSLQQNNLRWGGAYDAATDTITVLTSIGVSSGLTAGQQFPPPSDGLSGLYFICQNPGNNMTQNNLQGISHDAGDWALCLDATQGWLHVNANAAGGGGGGGAQYLNDLLDVEIGGAASPFSTAPAVSLSGDQLLRYDGGAGLWRNTDIIDGGSID